MAAAKINRQCEFEDCSNKHDSHGYCTNHAAQYRKYGHPLSKAEKQQHLSESNKGKKQTLGKTWSIKDTSKMKGRHPKTEFKKGCTSHNAGKTGWMTPEHQEALRKANTGRPAWNKGTTGLLKAWNKIGDGITPEQKLLRHKFRKTMQASVFARDNYTCQMCQQYSGNLQVDHIKRWSEYPELRFDIDNCRTLCMACHYFITFKRKLPEGVIWGHNLNRRIAS